MHIGAVFVQALIGLRLALTSLPKTAGTVRNVAVVPQALLGQGLKLRLAAVDLPPDFRDFLVTLLSRCFYAR